MKIYLYINNDRVTGYQTFPIVDGMIDIDENLIPTDLTTGKYQFKDGKFIDAGYTEEKNKEIEKMELDNLRGLRIPLLKAYDTYKINVLYGIEKTSTLSEQASKELVDEWYQKILDLNKEAINNPPEKIKYYL